jgi:hypothetical protein
MQMPFTTQLLIGLSLMACGNPASNNQQPSTNNRQLITNSQQQTPTDSIKSIQPIPIPGFELYADSLQALGDSSLVEIFTSAWTTDQLLCDQYQGSVGDNDYDVYRLAKSKKITYEHERGAYCQGDSDFDNRTLFDLQGHYVWSSNWALYAPQSTTFYTNGVALASLQKPGEGEDEYAPRIVKENDKYVYTAPDDPVQERRERVANRKRGLEKLMKMLTDTAEIDEAQNALDFVSELLANDENWQWKAQYILRRAGKDESTMVSRFEVKLHENPKNSAKVVDKISYYDGYVDVTEISADGKWYKVSGTHKLTNAKFVGWIERKFIVPGIFDLKRK